jgi:hypothetical protein
MDHSGPHRESSEEVLERAQRLMADAVHAEHTFFSTCGSSLTRRPAASGWPSRSEVPPRADGVRCAKLLSGGIAR